MKIKEGEHQLVLTSKKTGTDSAMEIEVKGDSELNKILNSSQMQPTVAAENAKVTINGIQIEYSSNEIKDAPEGITFTLVKTAEKDKASGLISETVTVARDIEPTKKAIKNWVDAYNNLHSFYKTQTKYEPTKLGEAPSANNGVLLNDRSSAMSFSQVKNLTFNVQNRPDMNHLNHFGIGFNHEGKLTIDDKKLDKTLKDNPVKVKQFFMGDGETTGFATETFNYLKKTLDTLEGPLHLTTESLNKQIKILNNKMESAQKNIETKLKTLRDKFIAMDKAIS
ncbi:hypothetical protein E3U36_01815 [Arsenophonus endosymbiont of Aphis craccivora]|uniref:flagellar filament capping protein FliD n=1 Tax=Arsenophonus endosymbiont of Aphis craccivora TaxID=1231049 RepID=UPI0015DCB1FD|nr:flagellar filament capping protein FliD [Arsenophonus endosymbiont of Aphis craccivora]QLK87220.1 hypothetical protein E3U36_01815 [Arsenophonus endosymbiont of Aphis craccivora]